MKATNRLFTHLIANFSSASTRLGLGFALSGVGVGVGKPHWSVLAKI